MKKIFFLFPYPLGTAASQRFRFEEYINILNENDFETEFQSFLDSETWDILYKPGFFFKKAKGILKGYLRRLYLLGRINKFDFIFIHREATPLGPPIIEFIISKFLKKKIIFDFDDAIWLPNTSGENRIAGILKWHSKTASICKWSYKISAGNKYLAGYAMNYNKNVIINPTTIDNKNLHNQLKNQLSDNLTIGWTGTHSTLTYLQDILPIIKKLEENHSFTFLVICDKDPAYNLKSYQFIKWNKLNEINDLLRINIGLMPLVNSEWTKGKCGFKALQYMSLGIPPVVSPIGVNVEIVHNGENGLVCNKPEEWENAIIQLLSSKDLREQMGKSAWHTVENNYSVQANCLNFLSLFT